MKPPEGIPEKRFIRVSWLEEDPYIMVNPPTSCFTNKGVICQMKDNEYLHLHRINITEEKNNVDSEYFKCCTGFCVDLLEKFSNDLSFDFEMFCLDCSKQSLS